MGALRQHPYREVLSGGGDSRQGWCSESGSVAELWFECRIPGCPEEGADDSSPRCQAQLSGLGPGFRPTGKTVKSGN